MSFEEMDTEDSASSLGEVDSLDDDFDAMCLESDDSNEEGTGDDMDSHTWNEIQPESDAQFMEDYGLIQGKLRGKQSDHSAVSRKSCAVFTSWHTI